ncbi:MAG TPA: bifunctional adenosylcobinamide kinase/adenosylcobinamide-phosphate guanylyltransferase [Pedococcus sp.]|jgi:adenosylcobinamide kinase/adenosylcobinamide-phosphate guanylyltransferase|nr:bifunctional adenosylcobinamide kinase/adenosylcobinamide-phosphate guanylyltransferase [Pedococcus sp.]
MTATLVLGGVRSGKSRYAEQLLREHAEVLVVAPGYPADEGDPQWAERVAAHRARRPESWTTLESLDLAGAIREAASPVLIDCLGLWLTRFIDGIGGWENPREASIAVAWALRDLSDAWKNAPTDVVAVTNEVGLGVVPAAPSGALFRDELGRINATLSSLSDHVALVVAGRVLDLSAAPVVGD